MKTSNIAVEALKRIMAEREKVYAPDDARFDIIWQIANKALIKIGEK